LCRRQPTLAVRASQGSFDGNDNGIAGVGKQRHCTARLFNQYGGPSALETVDGIQRQALLCDENVVARAKECPVLPQDNRPFQGIKFNSERALITKWTIGSARTTAQSTAAKQPVNKATRPKWKVAR
jgi:hypothetical protein